MPATAPLTDPSLKLLAELIHERTGVFFDAARMESLADKIAALVSEGRFNSYLDYYYYLKYDPHTVEAWQRLQTALAVNESYFWREFEQVRYASRELVPALQRERPREMVRIWHAGCATGEEPYSMAIALAEAGCFARGPVEIVATDFNIQALNLARQARYSARSLRAIPPQVLERYFTTTGSQRQLDDSIRARVEFRYLNLLDDESMQRMGGFNIIFCRNVFIYFSERAVRRVAGWFHAALQPDGILFVGAVESLLRLPDQFELVDAGSAFAYKKRPSQPPKPAGGA